VYSQSFHCTVGGRIELDILKMAQARVMGMKNWRKIDFVSWVNRISGWELLTTVITVNV
jgi:hypothetical protein